MKFYEVRRQLQNRNRWVSDAFLQKKEDAEYYAKMKRKWFEEKYKNHQNLKALNINFEVVEHEFTEPSNIT